ncbi:unnamed protein product [Litomosoides sigmodontis]|uniref:Uncharacterized protein n=1 Tax=Litomosoides sigmodontis TaxID=42156 RepID=A0A3P6S123_LITSI|nr:unnamed protein product [Litomosoides sigmodontis]
MREAKQLAMDFLNEIEVPRGCDPSVVINYVAIVREAYLNACNDLRKEDIGMEERGRKTFVKWQQTEKHFGKIKYAMLDYWPVGNESGLMARIIRQCYEAAERARKRNRFNLSENKFNEVQQYCEIIENISFCDIDDQR